MCASLKLPVCPLKQRDICMWNLLLLEDLYSNTLSCVRVDGELSPWFKISSGVCQGCVLAPGLFLEPMDWLLDRVVHRGYLGPTVGNEIFSDLDFADDVSL